MCSMRMAGLFFFKFGMYDIITGMCSHLPVGTSGTEFYRAIPNLLIGRMCPSTATFGSCPRDMLQVVLSGQPY